MARKPKPAASAPAPEPTPEAVPEMATVTILAEGVRADGWGACPVGISIHVTPERAAELKAAGLAK